MNKAGHVFNAVGLSLGIAAVLHLETGAPFARTTAVYGVPILLGALVPDVDTVVGTHRKTFHNLLVLGTAVAFPLTFGNLRYVWIGVLTHYALDLLGNVRGMAVFYPLPGFYDIPVGVPVDSRWADLVTVLVTGLEIALFYAAVRLGPRLDLVPGARQLLFG